MTTAVSWETSSLDVIVRRLHGNMREMIPVIPLDRTLERRPLRPIDTIGTAMALFAWVGAFAQSSGSRHDPVPATSAGPTAASGIAATLAPPPAGPSSCLPSGDGYLRARVAGAVEATIDWTNAGTRCQGEPKLEPPGIRMSFQRAKGGKGKSNLLFVFGLTGIREGAPAHASGVNLTLIVQGTPRIFGTLGDSRCTVDSLTQTPLQAPHTYRVEARGFCTQPAHAVRGDGDVLVSTFDFAGPVNYAQ